MNSIMEGIIVDEIYEVLDNYQPFDNWKDASRALNEIIELVGWARPDERSQFIEKGEDENGK